MQKCFVPTVKGQQATTFYYNAILEWNKLPAAMKIRQNHNIFKSGVKPR